MKKIKNLFFLWEVVKLNEGISGLLEAVNNQSKKKLKIKNSLALKSFNSGTFCILRKKSILAIFAKFWALRIFETFFFPAEPRILIDQFQISQSYKGVKMNIQFFSTHPTGYITEFSYLKKSDVTFVFWNIFTWLNDNFQII